MRTGTAIGSYEERIVAYEKAAARPRDRPRAPERRHPAPERRHPAPERRHPAPERRHPAPRQSVQRRRRAATTTIRFRVRRILALVVLFLLADMCLSFGGAMLRPSNVGLGVRIVEWLRDNGAAGVVSEIEAVYYSMNTPATGGAALKSLPHVGVARGFSARSYEPPAIRPAIWPSLPGEGVWHGTGPLVAGAPPVLVTTFRPDPNYPQMVAGVAWIDTSRTWLALYPGRYEPPNSGNALAEVPPQLRSGLLATFNAGFKLEDSGGGFYAGGHSYAPLRDGQATLIAFRDGKFDVRTWTGGPVPGPDVVFARQNLPLILSGGRLVSDLDNGALWGATLGNAVRVWRSAIGVDAHGDLLYAGADLQTAQSIAQILQRAGAVRAMELDINSEWVTFNFYGGWDAAAPQKLLPDMTRDATRYLTPDDRDFFAVYARGR
jgi:hypothetical protein